MIGRELRGLAAAVHRKLAAEKEAGWYEEFVNRIDGLREKCGLTLKTIERYRTVGELMLRSNFVTCLLP